MIRLLPLFVAVLGLLACASGSSAATATRDFYADPWWDDGLAEVAEYDLTWHRYGSLHPGHLTTIVVREFADPERKVKAAGAIDDAIPVLKYHSVRSVQTGVYRYEQSWTTFPRRADGRPLRLLVTSHEWCGAAARSWVDEGLDSELVTHSYFDGHGDFTQALALGDGVVFADQLPLVLRQALARGRVPDTIRVVPSQVEARRQSVEPVELRLQAGDPEHLTVPAGRYGVRWITVSGPTGSERFAFDTAFPHVLVAWRGGQGDRFDLRRLRRFDYWARNQPGDQ